MAAAVVAWGGGGGSGGFFFFFFATNMFRGGNWQKKCWLDNTLQHQYTEVKC